MTSHNSGIRAVKGHAPTRFFAGFCLTGRVGRAVRWVPTAYQTGTALDNRCSAPSLRVWSSDMTDMDRTIGDRMYPDSYIPRKLRRVPDRVRTNEDPWLTDT